MFGAVQAVMTTAFRRISARVQPVIERECLVTRSEVLGRGRVDSVAKARQWLYWALLRTGLSAREIGLSMGRSDHSNVVRGAERCSIRQRMHPHEAERAERILKELEGVKV